MNVDNFLKPKSCCYCIPLRTGCYIIGALYLLLGAYLFFDQLAWAVRMFEIVDLGFEAIEVVIAYDLSPSIMIVFSLVLLYGLKTEEPKYIMQGANTQILIILLVMYDDVVGFLVPHWLVHQVGSFADSIYLALGVRAVHFFFFTIIRSHYKDVSSRKARRNTNTIDIEE